MKWKIIRLFLPLLVLGFVVPLILPGSDGKPIMSVSDWLPDRDTVAPVTRLLKRVPDVKDQGLGAVTGPEKVYRWKDEYGVWHFTNNRFEAPAHAQGDDMPEATNSMLPPHQSGATGAGTGAVALPGLDSMEELPDMADLKAGAEHIRDLARERNETLEKL